MSIRHHAFSFWIVLATAKGRTTNVVLWATLRKMFASAFRSGHTLAFRWIPSGVKFADKGPLYFDLDFEGSKCLLAQIAAMVPGSGGRDHSAKGSLVKRVRSNDGVDLTMCAHLVCFGS